ncbi:MAG: serine/threonine protein kinase [Planctomycetaceae bacterium]|nr:serine/threonine protein kinase [Planctomycetaceae bacterium]
MSNRLGLALFACVSLTAPCVAGDWTQFRGPGGLGISQETSVPTTWSGTRNIAWKAKLPGAGTSSPIIVGDKIFLTCYSGYGLDQRAPGQMTDLKRHVVCLQRGTGEFVWSEVFDPMLDESEYAGGNDSRHGYASSTIASDGKRLYVFFGKSGVYCLSFTGDQLWHSTVGSRIRGWGSGSSPLLYNGLVIINASVESGSLVALDAQTGEEAWRAGGIRSSWNTPALVEAPGGGAELVISAQRWLMGFEPSTGNELWRCNGVPTYSCPSVISHDGVVYVTGGRGTQYTFAVRAGGRGDVTATHELWRVAKGSNVSSPIYHNGHLYLASDSRGIAYCFDVADGTIVYQERMRPTPGRIYASPLLVGGNVYYPSQYSGTFVVAAKPQFELVAHNVMGDDDPRTNACPVAHDGQLLIRNDGFLYCIGKN